MDWESSKQLTLAFPELDDRPSLDVAETARLPLVRQKQRSRWQRLGIGAIAGLALISGIAAIALRLSTSERSAALENNAVASALPVDVVRVETANSYEVARSYTGEIEAPRTSELSFERSGLAIALLADEGDAIEAGTAIARLDISRLETQRSELVARKAQAVARLQELEAGPRVEDIATAEAALEREMALLRELQAGPRVEDIATAEAVLAQETALLRELQVGPRVEDIDTARANVRNIEERLQLARLKAQRRQGLYREGAVSQEQADEATTEAVALQSELNAARRQLDELRSGTRIEQIDAQVARANAARSQLEELQSGTRIEQIDAQVARTNAARSQLEELQSGTRIEQIDAQAAIVQQIDAQIASLDIELQKSWIYAPFSGTVSVRHLDEGTVVEMGQPIVRLVENSAPEVRVGVPTHVAATLKAGDRYSAEVGDRTYPAEVRSILPEVDAATRTQTVILLLEIPSAIALAPGAVARLQLSQTEKIDAGFWLPATALVRAERGLWACYVPIEVRRDAARVAPTTERSHRIERRVIEVLHERGDRVLVRGTLQPGDVVVSSGTQRLVPGQLVTLN